MDRVETLDFRDAGARRSAVRPLVNPLVAEIVEALLDLGGAAHRDAVLKQVASRQGAAAVTDGLRVAVLDAFEQLCRPTSGPAIEPLTHLPFGAGSHRWALTRDALSVLRTPVTRI